MDKRPSFEVMDNLRVHIKNINELKDMLDKSKQEFKSPSFCLVFHPEDVDESIKWYKKNFNRNEIPLIAGTGEYADDPMKAHQDDWRIRIGWFEIDSGKRIDTPNWFDKQFENQLMIKSMRADKEVKKEDDQIGPDIKIPGS